MLIEEEFWKIMQKEGIDQVGILPCDKLKTVLALLPEGFKCYNLTREEEGVGISAGAFLGGGKPALLIQSTGIGNSINALMSLHKTYEIPLPIIASWRGVYKEAIEAQKPLGRALTSLLKALEIPYIIIENKDEISLLAGAIRSSFKENIPYVVLISPKVWEDSTSLKEPQSFEKRISIFDFEFHSKLNPPKITRYEAIKAIADMCGEDDIIVCNMGYPSRELFHAKDRALNFYMTGSLGLVSAIGLGIAENTEKDVWVFDGDGSLLMNLNILTTIGVLMPKNLRIFCLDNGTYGSTGDQPTPAYKNISLSAIALAHGIKKVQLCHEIEENREAIEGFGRGPDFIHVIVRPGNAQLALIPLKNREIKERFMRALK
ncbi:MAG: sulfopyruvate decarboxylase subunit alpha [Asgard group archaeon]